METVFWVMYLFVSFIMSLVSMRICAKETYYWAISEDKKSVKEHLKAREGGGIEGYIKDYDLKEEDDDAAIQHYLENHYCNGPYAIISVFHIIVWPIVVAGYLLFVTFPVCLKWVYTQVFNLAKNAFELLKNLNYEINISFTTPSGKSYVKKYDPRIKQPQHSEVK